jgi:hypothetical protein
MYEDTHHGWELVDQIGPFDSFPNESLGLHNGVLAVSGAFVPGDPMFIATALFKDNDHDWSPFATATRSSSNFTTPGHIDIYENILVAASVAPQQFANLITIFGMGEDGVTTELEEFAIGSGTVSNVASDNRVAVAAKFYGDGVYVFEAVIPEPHTTAFITAGLPVLLFAMRRYRVHCSKV